WALREIFCGHVGDGRRRDLREALATIPLENFHPLVELRARELDVRLHALTEGSVAVVVVLPELADDAQGRDEELVHALVHHVPPVGRAVDEAVEEKDAVPDMPALVAREKPDPVEQARKLAVGRERL